MGKPKIRQILEDKGLTVQEAAHLCGLPVPTVSSHYYGQRRSMSAVTALKYSQGLGVSVEDVLGVNLKKPAV
ncbi:MAG: helix-turn-helix transcriptional regulator [Desulfovibrionaceae bacterium]